MRFLALKVLINCVCLKSITLWNCQFLYFLLNFSRIPGNSENIFCRPSNCWCSSVICCYKGKFFWSILFLKKSQRRGTLLRLFVKGSHLFNRISLKQTLCSGRKPASTCQNPDIIALAAIFYLNVLEWFLLIMCNEHTLSRSTNLLSSNHLTLCFWLWREDRKHGLRIFISCLR